MTAGWEARRLKVAYHEAGHAVVALALGRFLADARLDPRGGGAVREGDFTRDTYEEILVLLAGVVSEQVRAEGPGWVGIRSWAGAEIDLPQARAIARKLAPADPDVLLNRAIADARAIVVQPDRWAAIERVAAALLERGRLDRPELLRALAGGPK